jgi:phage terminase small subunit
MLNFQICCQFYGLCTSFSMLKNKVMVMPPLDNPRWERFAQELAKGQSQTGAYLTAGYKGAKSPTTAASRLLTNVKVAARVKELQQRGAERAEVTVASLIADLDEDRKLARGAGQASAAVAATMAKAKLLGLVIDRKEVGAPGEFDEIENMSADELAREQLADRHKTVAVLPTVAAVASEQSSRCRKRPGLQSTSSPDPF